MRGQTASVQLSYPSVPSMATTEPTTHHVLFMDRLLVNQLREVFSPSVLPESPEMGAAKVESAVTEISGIVPSRPVALKDKQTLQTLKFTGKGFRPNLELTVANPFGKSYSVLPAYIESTDPTLVVAVALLILLRELCGILML